MISNNASTYHLWSYLDLSFVNYQVIYVITLYFSSDKAILEDKLQLLLDIAGLIEITKAKKPPAPRNRRKQTPKRIENRSKTSQPTNQSIRSSSLADQLFERSERLWADRRKDRLPHTYGNGLSISGCDTNLISYDDHIAELPRPQFDESDVVGPPLPQAALEECEYIDGFG